MLVSSSCLFVYRPLFFFPNLDSILLLVRVEQPIINTQTWSFRFPIKPIRVTMSYISKTFEAFKSFIFFPFSSFEMQSLSTSIQSWRLLIVAQQYPSCQARNNNFVCLLSLEWTYLSLNSSFFITNFNTRKFSRYSSPTMKQKLYRHISLNLTLYCAWRVAIRTSLS